ncbi:MAG: hypothetical protein OET44_03015 [Gammaproteobacteria bacterium]|nr:hypothetical protein [Gammaproteobacteria bacterium]
MAQTFSMLYEFFPTTLRLMIQEETFVDFCLSNRKYLIERWDQDELPAGAAGEARAKNNPRESAAFG